MCLLLLEINLAHAIHRRQTSQLSCKKRLNFVAFHAWRSNLAFGRQSPSSWAAQPAAPHPTKSRGPGEGAGFHWKAISLHRSGHYSTDLFTWMIQLTIQSQDAERCLSTALHVALQSHLHPLENTKTSAQNSGSSQRAVAEESRL